MALMILSLTNLIPEELIKIIIGYIHNYTNVKNEGCKICKVSWDSYIPKFLKPLKELPLYPIIIWGITKFEIEYTCSKKCKYIFEIGQLINEEYLDRIYILSLEKYLFSKMFN